MTNEEISEAVKKNIAELLEAPYVRMEDLLADDLGADSLDMVEIAMRMEDVFGIEVLDTEMNSAKTVAEWIAMVERKVSENG